MRPVRSLVLGYLGVSVLAVVVLALLHGDPAAATDAAWVRAVIVVLSAALTLLFTRQAMAGSRRGYLRLRLVSGLMTVAIVVVTALPGFLPGWLRVEQVVCGVLLLAVVVVANGRDARAAFAQR